MNTSLRLVYIVVIFHLRYGHVDSEDNALFDECSQYCVHMSTFASDDIHESTPESTHAGMATPGTTESQQMTPIHKMSSSVTSSTPGDSSVFQESSTTAKIFSTAFDNRTTILNTTGGNSHQTSGTSLSDQTRMSDITKHTDLITRPASSVTSLEKQTTDRSAGHFQGSTSQSEAFSTTFYSTSTHALSSGTQTLITEDTTQVPTTINNELTNPSTIHKIDNKTANTYDSSQSVLSISSTSQNPNDVTTRETEAFITNDVVSSQTSKQITSATQTPSTNTTSSTEATSLSRNTTSSIPPFTTSTNAISLSNNATNSSPPITASKNTSFSSNTTISRSITPTSTISSAEALSSNTDISSPPVTPSVRTTLPETISLSPNSTSSRPPITSSTNTISSADAKSSSSNTTISRPPITPTSTIASTKTLSFNTDISKPPATPSARTTTSADTIPLSTNTITKSPTMQSTSTNYSAEANSSHLDTTVSDSTSLGETISESNVTEVASKISSTASESAVVNRETSSTTGFQVSSEYGNTKPFTSNSDFLTEVSSHFHSTGVTSAASSGETLANYFSTDIQSTAPLLETLTVPTNTTVSVMSTSDNITDSTTLSTVEYNSTTSLQVNINQTPNVSNSNTAEDEPTYWEENGFLNEDEMEDSLEVLSTATNDVSLTTQTPFVSAQRTPASTDTTTVVSTNTNTSLWQNSSLLTLCERFCIAQGGVFTVNLTENVSSSTEVPSSSKASSLLSSSIIIASSSPVTMTQSTAIFTETKSSPSGRYENKSPAWGSAIFRLNFSISYDIHWKNSYGEETTSDYVVLVNKIRKDLLRHYVYCPGFQGIKVYRLRPGCVRCEYGIDISASFIRHQAESINETLSFIRKAFEKMDTTAEGGNLTAGFIERNLETEMSAAEAIMLNPCNALSICPLGHICEVSRDGNVTCVHRCTKTNPCQNGGICSVNEVGDTECRCKSDDSNVYYGQFCNKKDELLSLEYRYIIAITIGGAATLVIFAIVMYYICKRRISYQKAGYETPYLTDMDEYHPLGPNIDIMPLQMQRGIDNMGYGGDSGSHIRLDDGRDYTVYRDPQTDSKALVYQPSSRQTNPYSDTSLERSTKFHTEFYSSGRMDSGNAFEEKSRESEDKPSSGLRSNAWKSRSRQNDHDVVL